MKEYCQFCKKELIRKEYLKYNVSYRCPEHGIVIIRGLDNEKEKNAHI
jgi:predicted RNA-binding Zn-ribbon protein involved in translation (DUF1610 family)